MRQSQNQYTLDSYQLTAGLPKQITTTAVVQLSKGGQKIQGTHCGRTAFLALQGAINKITDFAPQEVSFTISGRAGEEKTTVIIKHNGQQIVKTAKGKDGLACFVTAYLMIVNDLHL